MSQLRGIRLRKFRKELSRHIYLIVIRHNVQKFLVTLLSKKGRRKLVNGMFLCQRSDLWQKKRCSKSCGLANGKLSSGREWSQKQHLLDLDLQGSLQIKKNPNGPMYTSLGVMTRGTIIEVNVSELGLVTPAGKVVWGKTSLLRSVYFVLPCQLR